MGNNRRPSKFTHFFFVFFLYFCRLRYVSLDGRINSHTIKNSRLLPKDGAKVLLFSYICKQKDKILQKFYKIRGMYFNRSCREVIATKIFINRMKDKRMITFVCYGCGFLRKLQKKRGNLAFIKKKS